MIFDVFIASLFADSSFSSLEEKDDKFYCKFSSNGIKENASSDELREALKFIAPFDKLIISIQFAENEAILFESSSGNLDDFLDNFNRESKFFERGDNIVTTLTINKDSKNIQIYDLNVFTNTLSTLSLFNALSIFNRVLSKSDYVVFYVHNIDKSFETSSMSFCNILDKNYTDKSTNLDRQKRQENAISVSNYSQFNTHKLCPDDFYIINPIDDFKLLNNLFERYATILSVVYLFDITSIEDNNIEFKINGYKSIRGSINTKELNTEKSKDYFFIYNWVYNGGNLNDKIGLARNIISLHFEKSGLLELKGDVFQSVQSSYKVYEKQNIKQYIEIRNKISDQLLDFNNRANKIIETFANGFQKNALALITFYFSIIISKLIGSNNLSNIFTFDSTILVIVFVVCSTIYYFVSRWEVIEQKKRFINSYQNLKERYTDLLEINDIKRILNDDKEYNQDIKFIDDKLKKYTYMWIGILAIVSIATMILFFVHNALVITSIVKFIIYSGSTCI